jgi:hypothetical protein
MTSPRQVIDRHVAAFAAKDADAEPWSSDAELVTPVGQFQGREQVLGFLYFDQAEFMAQLGVMSGLPAEGAATQA